MADSLRLACMLGDGIGPEIVTATRRVVDAALHATGADPVEWLDLPMGAAAIAETGYAIPPANYDTLTACEGWLVGPHDSESYPRSWRDGTERVPSAELRGRYHLFANVRPSRTRDGVPRRGGDMDLVIVRENTEGLYADRNMYIGNGEFMPTPDVVLTMGLFTRAAASRIATTAFDLARARRRRVTVVHKANVMPRAFGLFLEEIRRVGESYPDVAVDDYLFDSMAAYLVRRPDAFDVIVTENLFGDTLSDLAGELAGSLGTSGALNAGERHAMAQAAHGSAPDIAGRGVADPIGMMVSAALLLQWLGERHSAVAVTAAGPAIEAAIDAVLRAGTRTPDLGGTATTAGFTDAVIAELSSAQG